MDGESCDCALLAFGSVHSWADISPIKAIRIGIGEPVRPVHDADVRMVSEEVNISLGDSTAFVSCRFDLKNEGTTKNLPVGFPCVYGYDISNFRAWVNGKEIPVKMIEPIPAHKLNGREPVPFRALFTVPFGSDGKTVVVETRYRNRLVPNEYWGMKDLCFEYILQTGSYWKGYIESAKITVDYGNIPPGRSACISPDGYTKNGHSITWRLKDFKPRTSRDDIRVDIIQKELYSRMGEAYFLLMENPSSARGHYLLGTILFNRENKENRYKDAEREFLRAVALDPDCSTHAFFSRSSIACRKTT